MRCSMGWSTSKVCSCEICFVDNWVSFVVKNQEEIRFKKLMQLIMVNRLADYSPLAGFASSRIVISCEILPIPALRMT